MLKALFERIKNIETIAPMNTTNHPYCLQLLKDIIRQNVILQLWDLVKLIDIGLWGNEGTWRTKDRGKVGKTLMGPKTPTWVTEPLGKWTLPCVKGMYYKNYELIHVMWSIAPELTIKDKTGGNIGDQVCCRALLQDAWCVLRELPTFEASDKA